MIPRSQKVVDWFVFVVLGLMISLLSGMLSSAHAAQPWDRWYAEIRYQPGDTLHGVCEPRGGSTTECQAEFLNVLNSRQPNASTPYFVQTHGAATLADSIDGYVTFTVGGGSSGAGWDYRAYTKRIGNPSPYDLSVDQAQLIILSALLLWALAWGIRQAQRIGTHHHD